MRLSPDRLWSSIFKCGLQIFQIVDRFCGLCQWPFLYLFICPFLFSILSNTSPYRTKSMLLRCYGPFKTGFWNRSFYIYFSAGVCYNFKMKVYNISNPINLRNLEFLYKCRIWFWVSRFFLRKSLVHWCRIKIWIQIQFFIASLFSK